MKKAFDQTVRDLKREVNKKVLKVPRIEQKVLDATSNEPWGPHGSLLADIAHATRHYAEFQIIMSIIWKRINDTGKNWRHVYKGLTVLEYLVAHGSEKVIDEIKEHSYQIATLSEFQYLSSSGRDEGSNVRKKSQNLVALVNDKERIQEVRQKAHANRDKYRGSFSTGYGDQYEDDHHYGSYGSRDDHRNGNGRERDYAGYRDDERYGRRDPYSRDGDDYRGNRGNDDNQFGSRNKNLDKGRSFDEDDRYSSRSGGGRMDDPSQDDKKLEQSVDLPPSYEEAVGESHGRSQNEIDGQIPGAKTPTPALFAANLPPSEAVNLSQAPPVSSVLHVQKEEVDAFDEFDPRGSNGDFFGLSGAESISSLALVPVSAPTSSQEVIANNSESVAVHNLSSPFSGFDQTGENPFGEPVFKAVPVPQDTNKAPLHQQPSLSPSPPPFDETVNSFSDPLDSLVNGHPHSSPLPSGLVGLQLVSVTLETDSNALHAQSNLSSNNNVLPSTYPSNFHVPQGQGLPSTYPFSTTVPPQSSQTPLVPTTQSATAPFPSAFLGVVQPRPFSQTPQVTATQTAAAPVIGPMPPQPKDKFETKSTVWADTLSRGLVDLNISGPKTNPLADIGVDFDSINRKEKRKEKATSAPVSTINMGKAMGTGSGMGRAGTVGLVAPPNPMIGAGMGMNHPMGMGMGIGGYAGAFNQQTMAMNMGMGMNMGVAMNKGIGGVGMPPGSMPSGQNIQGNNGYNPTGGMGGYGSQIYGGYR